MWDDKLHTVSICCRGPVRINTLEGFMSTFHAWISQKNWCIFTMFWKQTIQTMVGFWICSNEPCTMSAAEWETCLIGHHIKSFGNLLYPVILAITKWRTKMLPLKHLGLSGDHSLGAWDIRDSPIEPRKKTSDTFHWILVVNRDPYIEWFIIIAIYLCRNPLYMLNN